MKKSTAILIWGAATGIACAFYGIILNMNSLSLSGWYYISILIVFLGLFLGIRQYRDKANEGYLTFGKGYVVSLLMTAIITLVGVVSLLITLQVEPDLGNKLLSELQIKLINSGLNEEQLDRIMKFYQNAFTPTKMIVNSFFGNIITGAILGLIATGINTKKKPLFDDANEVPNNTNS